MESVASPAARPRGGLHLAIRLIGRRLLAGLIALLALLTFVFFAIDLLPGDAAAMLLGRDATPEAVASLRVALGLDRPLLQRYVMWLWQIAHGDFGQSVISGRSVGTLVFTRFANTIFLASLAAVIAVPLALTLGVLTALYRNSAFDRTTNAASLSFISFPDFFVAYTLIFIFSITYNIFPSIANVSASTPFWQRVYVSLLPVLTLVLLVTTHIMRMTRAAIIDVLSRPYVEMARLKGLPPLTVLLRHALPNVWAPIINVIVFNLAWLVMGVVIIEVVFAYPGLGQLLVDSVAKRDVPVVQACSLIFAVTYILLNLTADILAILANPRLRRAE